jgi:hypothetical protein
VRFVIEIDCNNAEFADGEEKVTRSTAALSDINGNTCGTVRFLKDRKR